MTRKPTFDRKVKQQCLTFLRSQHLPHPTVNLAHIYAFSGPSQVPDPCASVLQSKMQPLSHLHTHIRLRDINISLYGWNAIWVSAFAPLAALNLSDFGEFKETCEGTDGFDNCTTSEWRSHMLIKFVSLLEKTNSELSCFVTFQAVATPKRTQSPGTCLNHPHPHWN